MRTRIFAQFLICLATFVLAAAAGCKHQTTAQNLFPADPLTAASIKFQYAVYLMPKHAKDPTAILRQTLIKDFPQLKLVDQLPETPREMFVRARLESNIKQKYVPPSVDSLEYSGYGLSARQGLALQNCKEAYILDFSHPNEKVWEALRAADLLVEALARDANGLVWDETTREVFTPDIWHARRLAKWTSPIPEISTHTVVHVYENGKFDRAISLGMSKAGLPDVVVEELDESSANQVVTLINVISQLLTEGAATRKSGKFRIDLRSVQNDGLRSRELESLKPNAKGVACTTFKTAAPEEGDPDNRLIQLTFSEYPGNDTHSQQQAAIDGLFGWEDSIKYVEHTDQLLEASRKATAELPRLKADFKAGLKPGEYILVKAPFDTPEGGREWMWVEVRTWNGNNIEGLLENTPDKIPTLHTGQLVRAREDDAFDYIRHFPDGHEEGNATGELLSRFEQNPDALKATHKSPPVPDCKD